MSRLLTTLLGLCLICCGANHAEAKKPNSDEKDNAGKKVRKRTTKPKAKNKKPKKKPNMPPGWNWPPTEAMKAKGAICLTQLSDLGVTWKAAKARRYITTPIVVPSMDFAGLKVVPTFRKGPFVMDCHLALAIGKVAPELLRAKVRALRFSSIHSVRNVRVGGKRKRTLSRHALGLAIDVYEIAPTSGPVLVVKKHYYKRPLASTIEKLANASDQFRMVLSPANDPKSHYDHLHFEASVGDKKRRVRRRGNRSKHRRIVAKRRARAKARLAKAKRAHKRRAQAQRARKRRARARRKRQANRSRSKRE